MHIANLMYRKYSFLCFRENCTKYRAKCEVKDHNIYLHWVTYITLICPCMMTRHHFILRISAIPIFKSDMTLIACCCDKLAITTCLHNCRQIIFLSFTTLSHFPVVLSSCANDVMNFILLSVYCLWFSMNCLMWVGSKLHVTI